MSAQFGLFLLSHADMRARPDRTERALRVFFPLQADDYFRVLGQGEGILVRCGARDARHQGKALPSKLIGWPELSSVRLSMTSIIAATDSAAVGAGVLPWSCRRNAVSAAPGATSPTMICSPRKSV